MNINYEYYKIFYYVAKYKSFTLAANILMSNQPNVSRAISNLEGELGCRLFVRSNRGVTLTPEGQRLYSRVSVALRQLLAAEQELTGAMSLQHGIVSVGVNETALHTVFLPLLKPFHQQYPGIRIHLSSVTTPQAISELKNGSVDFALVTTPTGITRPLREYPIMQFHEILTAGPRFAHLAEKTFDLEQLQDYPLILLNSQTSAREFYRDFFLEHNLTPHPEIEATTTDQILPMLKNDLGLGFLPDALAREALEKQEIFQIPLSCPMPPRSVCLVKDTSRPTSIAAKELEKLLLHHTLPGRASDPQEV